MQQKPGFFKKVYWSRFVSAILGLFPPPQFYYFPSFFFIFLLLPNFIIFPPPTPPPHFLRIFFHLRLHRPYIHPRLNFFFQHSFVNIYDHHYIFSLHHHHHISIVFTPPIVFPQTGPFGQPQAKIAKMVKKACFFKRNVSDFITSYY